MAGSDNETSAAEERGPDSAHPISSWRLPKWLEALGRGGTRGLPPARAREVSLTNLVALLAIGATIPYQAFYVSDLARYGWVFAANVLFFASYVSTLLLNRVGRFETARAFVIATGHVQLFVISMFLGTASGVHLFFFPLSASLGAVFGSRDRFATLLFIGVGALLFVVCDIAFPPGSTPITMPESTLRVMYIASAAGSLILTGGFSYLFRREIDRAEAALTQSNRALERLTNVDPVTGLANRRAMDAYLTHHWSLLEHGGLSVSVALIDVDRFKAFNDHYGHLAGDRCLERVAEALRAATRTRRRDDLIARYGGEEFVIVLPATSEDYAAEVAEQVRAAIMQLDIPHGHSGVAPVVTVSVGVAGGSVAELEDFSALLHRADLALYAAKDGGRNRVVRWQAIESEATLLAASRCLTVEEVQPSA